MKYVDLNQYDLERFESEKRTEEKRKKKLNDKISKTDNEWKSQLSSEEYSICRGKNTEAPFTGIYLDCKDKGDRKSVV